MDDRRHEELANTYAQAALDYSTACEAFEIATKSHRASVLAYFSAMRLRSDVNFDLPLSEPAQDLPKFEI
jgi:hypothetical protein|tara:strand:+ start:83 stop:292 length:210 start_codon:yes stop_codon:yes gene_type:complete